MCLNQAGVTEVREERRIVTAVFADVVGSTPLAERLDPEEVKLVLGEAIGRAIKIVEAYGGTVKDLAGDGVLALFGAPIAHEDDPERAIRSALEIASDAASYGQEVRRAWGIENFAMRIGIHTGEVVVGQVGAGSRVEYGAVGDALNTAARLQASAAPGSVLVSETTRRLAGERFDWSPPQTLQLRGKVDPVVAFGVTGVREAALPAQALAPMVGRQGELAAGRELIDRLGAGSGGVLFILGEPGIGKSRLAAELRESASAHAGCEWLEGRCVSYGQSLPYWPFRDLIRNWLEVSATEPEVKVRIKLRRRTEELFPGRALEVYPYLGTILGINLEPEAAARLSQLSPESLQYRTFEVFTELLTQLAKAQPVVISLDDLHWADSTSLALTERLLALTEEAPVLLTMSQRLETEHGSWQLKEKAAREYRHRFRELALQPLGRTSEIELLATLVSHSVLPDSLVERLLAYAEGNPFYLEQMVRSLMDRGVLLPENSHWKVTPGASLDIPETLEGVILARIDRLEAEWRLVVTAASVLGRMFGLQLLEAVTRLESSALRRAIHHLLRLDLFREEAGGPHPIYRFKHALIQETAYRTLVSEDRRALHRRAAEWFESFYGERLERVYGLIAHHWLVAADAVKAARYLKLAGDRARDEWALDEAIGHYRGLVPLLEEAGQAQEAAEVLFQLGTTLHLAMRYREANEVWQKAFQRWRPAAGVDQPATATLRLAVNQMPWGADPDLGLYSANQRLIDQVYDRLLHPRPGPYVVPGLAQTWQVSDDGRRYRLELRKDLTWNDGRPITATDVVWAIRRSLDPAGARTQVSHFSVLENAEAYASGQLEDVGAIGVAALDDWQVEFRLNRAAPYFLHMLTWPQAGPLRADLGGSGPFRLQRLEPEEVTIESDPGYRRPRRGNIGRVEWRHQQGDEALAALQSGDLDVVAVTANDPAMRGAGDPQVATARGAPVQSIFMHCNIRAHRTDVHLRQALAYATDRSALEPFLLPSQTIATGGLVPPGLLGHTPDIAPYFQPDLARASLSRSAHQGPLVVAFATEQRAPYVDALIECWRETLGLQIGVHEDVMARNTSFYGLAHVVLWHWIAGYPDPEYFLRYLLHSQSLGNLAGWSHPAFDALVDRALDERTGAGRLALFHQADRMAVQEQCVVIPVAYARFTVLLKPWVHGWWEWGAPWMSFDDLTVDERSPRYGSAAKDGRSA